MKHTILNPLVKTSTHWPLPRRGIFLTIAALLTASLGQSRLAAADNTFYGTDAGLQTTTGTLDSGFGVDALSTNTSGSGNTAIGAGTLEFSNGDWNTATGAFALLFQ